MACGGGGANLLDLDKSTLNGVAYGFSFTRNGDSITVTGVATRSGDLLFNLIGGYTDDSLSGKGYTLQVFDVTSGYTVKSVWGFRTETERAFAISLGGITEGQMVNCSMKPSVAKTAQTAYSPYSNICPITGRESVEVSHSGADTSDPTVRTISLNKTVYGGEVDVVSGTVKACPYYASYNGETLTGEWISDRDEYAEGTTPTIGAQVVNIGGELTETSITPTPITALHGTNNVWADSGEVSVEYKADLQLYIDKEVNS